jgi:hypothetical protein
MKFQIPEPLRIEHEELHGELMQAAKAGGRTGEAAKAVARVLHTHFVKEEEYALAPLGLLARLARGEVVSGMAGVLVLTDKLEAELTTMLAEHKEIVRALDELSAAAAAEGRSDVERFAEKLTLHAQTEEQVLYPAAILVGELVRSKLAR